MGVDGQIRFWKYARYWNVPGLQQNFRFRDIGRCFWRSLSPFWTPVAPCSYVIPASLSVTFVLMKNRTAAREGKDNPSSLVSTDLQ